MGLFDRIHEHHAQHVAEVTEDHYNSALVQWQEGEAHFNSLLDLANTFAGQTSAESPNRALSLGDYERAYFTVVGVGLVEARHGVGHYFGGYSGFSFRVANGVRYHVGGTCGHYEPGSEQPVVIDTGTATITNQRVVFQGPTQTREWEFTRLVGYQHFDLPPWTAIQVSDQQRTSGVLCDRTTAENFQFRLALALAHYRGEVPTFVAQLEDQLRSHEASRPVEPRGSRDGASAR